MYSCFVRRVSFQIKFEFINSKRNLSGKIEMYKSQKEKSMRKNFPKLKKKLTAISKTKNTTTAEHKNTNSGTIEITVIIIARSTILNIKISTWLWLEN